MNKQVHEVLIEMKTHLKWLEKVYYNPDETRDARMIAKRGVLIL